MNLASSSIYVVVRAIFLRLSGTHIFLLFGDNVDIFAAALLLSRYLSSLIFPPTLVITLYTSSNRFFWIHNALSHGRAVWITQNEYYSAAHFLQSFIKSWKSISGARFIAICWSSHLFEIFMVKKVYSAFSNILWYFEPRLQNKNKRNV